MKKHVAEIENKYLRRTLLMITIVPVILLAYGESCVILAWDILKEGYTTFKNVWNSCQSERF